MVVLLPLLCRCMHVVNQWLYASLREGAAAWS
jgi:hypothetical protein